MKIFIVQIYISKIMHYSMFSRVEEYSALRDINILSVSINFHSDLSFPPSQGINILCSYLEERNTFIS